MTTKGLIIGFAFATLFAAVSVALSQQVPPPSAQARQTEALVDKAAELIDKNGKAAFTEFRKKDSEWSHGATYLYVYDLKGNVLLNPTFPMREGTNVTGQKDAKGKLFHNEIIKTAETPRITERALSKMGLCEEGDDGWRSGSGSFRLLSRIS
jgi:methyl-accepting chemotaxis protein